MLIIKTENLSYQYTGAISPILNDIIITINQNSKIGLIGKNGCGKTTLIRLLTDELIADSGTIYKKNNLSIAYLEQNIEKYNNYTVLEYLISYNKDLFESKKIINNNSEYSEDLFFKALTKYEELGGYDIENKILKKNR